MKTWKILPLLCLILALLAEKRRRFSRMYEVMFSLPMAISMSATCMIFKLLLNNSIGLFNYSLGLDIKWFFDKNTALWGIAIITVWQNIGYEFLYLSAALRNVPQDVLEAATVDGANRYQKIIHIEIPALLSTASILLILRVGSLMSVGFEKAYLMQNGLNISASEVISTYVYKIGLTGTAQYSYAAAVGLFNTVVNLILLTICNTASRRLQGSSLW